jgi:hypothetical protein
MVDLEPLKEHLARKMGSLRGRRLLLNGPCQGRLALRLGAEPLRTEYSDCVWQGIRLSMKRDGFFLDRVRYARLLLGEGPDWGREVVMLVFYTHGRRSVRDILGVRMDGVFRLLRLDELGARSLLGLEPGPRRVGYVCQPRPRRVLAAAEFHISRHPDRPFPPKPDELRKGRNYIESYPYKKLPIIGEPPAPKPGMTEPGENSVTEEVGA